MTTKQIQTENTTLRAALAALFDQCAMVHKHWGDGSNAQQADAAITHARALLARTPPIPTPRTKAAPAPVDTATMTEAQIHAHYKRTAPLEDLKFFLRCPDLSPALRARAEAYLPKGCDKKTMNLLRDAWRVESRAAEQRIPGVGLEDMAA